MDIALLAILIVLNGVFAMSEIALVTARKSRLQRLAEDGDTSAAWPVPDTGNARTLGRAPGGPAHTQQPVPP